MQTKLTFNKTTHKFKTSTRGRHSQSINVLSQLKQQYKKIQRILTFLKVTAI
jgi:hypothetical protein